MNFFCKSNNVNILPEVREYFYELSYTLVEKGYFDSFEASEEYVDDLYNDIKTNLPIKSHKPAPPHFDKFGTGMYYASFKVNRNTTYYAFFTKYLVDGETIYLVRYVSNNHMIAQYL